MGIKQLEKRYTNMDGGSITQLVLTKEVPRAAALRAAGIHKKLTESS
jgi:hypothetical protein